MTELTQAPAASPRPAGVDPVAGGDQSWAARVTEYWSGFNAVDLFLGVGLAFNNYPVSAGLPFGMVLGCIILAVGFTRHPTHRVRWGGLMVLCALALFAFLIVESQINGQTWSQRILKFCILLAIAAVVGAGRVDFRAMIVGACMGSMVNVPAFYLGLTPNTYPPYLSGIYGDKNVAGMYYALWGVLGLIVIVGWWRVLWLGLCGTAVFLTGSRTSISAMVLALLWVGLRNRVSPVVRLLLTAGGFWGLLFVENNFAESTVYSDRTGTDWFRHQIDLATAAKETITPWYGLGLNQGFVILGEVRRAWFHDSYAQAFVEGGYIFLWATVIAYGVMGAGLLSQRLKVPHDLMIAEAGVIVVMVCAWKLGETFMTTGAFVVLGLAVGLRFAVPLEDYRRWWEP